MINDRYELIIPTTKEDFVRTGRDLGAFFELLPISEIIFIGPEGLEECVAEERKRYPEPERIKYLNENDLIPFESVYGAMKACVSEAGYTMDGNSRPGWYYQQFLKMAFSKNAGGEYYMSWGADTVPLRRIEMFNKEGKPFFDVKPEYMPGYFITIKKLFGIDKQIKKSFVSEHMLFNSGYMKELISEIEGLDLRGERFYEKIFYGMGIDNMKRGFSEFEAYGSWMLFRHPGEYALRDWSSLRLGGHFLESSKLSPQDIEWLSKDFDAITFEGYTEVIPELSEAFYNEDYRSRYTAKKFYTMFLENGFLGEYENGMIKAENGLYFPT